MSTPIAGWTIVVASRNRHKVEEIGLLLAALGARLVPIDDVAPGCALVEDDPTFEENALAKARYFHRRTGLPAMADDSGLVVDALGGQPGVHSKRWSAARGLEGHALDDANNAKLMRELAGRTDRSARYVCVAAFVDGERELYARGQTEGHIVDAVPSGDQGFGYDPYFYSTDLQCTFGDADVASKERISHRGRAFRALFDLLRK
jgi:XTP/dITP diphosphohydrolase